jgi:two-component system OmpR family sensor kinase
VTPGGLDHPVALGEAAMQRTERNLAPAVTELLQRLLAIDSPTLSGALTQAASVVAEVLRADKVDAFIYEASRDSLVAIGASDQPLSVKQRKLGLDVVRISQGGRSVQVFKSGTTYFNNHVETDLEESLGVRVALEIRSEMGVPLMVGDRRRGMMMVASLKPDQFTREDVAFAESIARWVGLVAHRAELLEEASQSSAAQARRQVAEELVTVLAHDLRNLIAPISARFDLLTKRARKEGRERDVRDAEGGLRTTRRMDAFVSDMLDVTRIDHGLLTIDNEPFDLAALAGEVCSTFHAPEVSVVLVSPGPIVVTGDRRRVRQCLENLTSNAVQHSPPGSQVSLTLERFSRGGREWVRTEVRDQGVGIPAEILPRIFQRFVTGGDSRGLGLGLYLAKQIALSHGGDLTVESSLDRGSVFRLELPNARGP